MSDPTSPSPATPVVVPIRSLGPGHRERIAAHLLSLDEQDRYLRFGYAANDEQITRYVDELDFERDDIFGIYNRKLELIAMAHLAFLVEANTPNCAEFGVSVLKKARGRGFGPDDNADPGEFAAHGGAFPIHVAGVGIIGSVTVSGAPSRDDHAFVVEALAQHLGLDPAPLRLDPP